MSSLSFCFYSVSSVRHSDASRVGLPTGWTCLMYACQNTQPLQRMCPRPSAAYPYRGACEPVGSLAGSSLLRLCRSKQFPDILLEGNCIALAIISFSLPVFLEKRDYSYGFYHCRDHLISRSGFFLLFTKSVLRFTTSYRYG